MSLGGLIESECHQGKRLEKRPFLKELCALRSACTGKYSF